ncbi:MAG: hypothetical protein AB8G14_00935 [Ilumatobacter sp.]
MQREKLSCLLIGTALAVASCGASDATEAGDVESFCASLAALEEIDTASEDIEPFVDGLRDVDSAAPAVIASDTAQLLSFIERSAEISGLPGDEQAAAIAEFATLQADFDEAAINVEDYARANCPDLEASFFGS